MANKIIKNAYREFYNNRMEKYLKNTSRKWLDESGNLLQEQIAKGVTMDDVNKVMAEEKKLFRKLNEPRDSQIYYQQLFFENMRKNDQALKINDKLYSVSGYFEFDYDPDNAKTGINFMLSPLDVPTDGGNVKAYNISDWFGVTHGQKGGTLSDDYVRNAYANNLNKFINNPDIEVVDLGREELKRRNKEVRDYVRSGKGSFETNYDAESLLGKPQKILRLQQGKGSYRTSRPIREPDNIRPPFQRGEGIYRAPKPIKKNYKYGDQFHDPRRKRQYAYIGAVESSPGLHEFISDQGVSTYLSLDQLQVGTGKGRKSLNADTLRHYDLTRMNFNYYNSYNYKSTAIYKDPEAYYSMMRDYTDDLKMYESQIKKRIKNHRMDGKLYKDMKAMDKEIDNYFINNPDKDINNYFTKKQLEKQKKKAEKEVKKIEKQTDKELENLEKNQQERKQAEAERQATEDSKNVSQPINKEVTKPQTEGKTVEETIKNTSEVVHEKVDNVTDDIINADIENISIQAPNVMNDEYVKQAINNESKNIEVGAAERFNTNESFEDLYAGLEETRKERKKLEPERTKINPEAIKTEPPKPEIPDIDYSRPNDMSNVVNEKNINETIDKASKKAVEEVSYNTRNTPKTYGDYIQNEVGTRHYRNINEIGADINYNQGTRKVNMPDEIETPEEAARRILDENLEAQLGKNRFGEIDFVPDTDGGPQVNPANIPNGPNYNPNVNLNNGYYARQIQSVYTSGNTNTVHTSANYTHRNVVPPAGGGGGKGPRGVGGNSSGGGGNGGGPTSPNNLTPNGPNGNGANKVVSRLDELKNMGKFEMLMTAGNVLGAISDYKDARREGHGVVSSALKAGVNFAIEEALGNWSLVYHGAKWLPKGIIKGTEALYKENRRMNSAANVQVFGGAQFQDTQQLATMRQSGMEMAKMAQYNLQQTLMGNEATYLHR